MLESGSQRVTVTVNPFLMGQSTTVPDSTVSVTLEADGETTVSGLGTQSITVNAGTDVIYSVEKETYTSRTNQIITPYSNITKDVTLYNLPVETVTITTVPADAIAKITCVETGNVTNGKTAQVEVGYHYTVEVNKVGLTKTTATFICSGVAEENVHEVVMDATITWGSVVPDNAVRIMSRDSTYQNPSINEPSFKVPCNAEVVYWKVEQPGYEAVTGSVRAVSPLTYIVDTTLATVVLPLAALHYTISVYPSDATVEASIYNPNTQQTRTITNVGSTVLDCYMGEQISYSVSKTNYETYTTSSPTTMGSTDLSASITLERAKNYVTISCEPSSGTISLYIDDSQTPITGTGTLTYPVPVGSTISYNASFAGADSETTTYTIENETPPYTDTVYLDPTGSEVSVVTETQTIHLPYGKWKFVLVGGGAGGYSGNVLATSSRSTAQGAPGYGGGGSGRVVLIDKTISDPNGKDVTFTIGSGGAEKTQGGDTILFVDGERHSTVAQGGYTSRISSDPNSSQDENMYRFYGGSGGSGAGAGGIPGYIQSNSTLRNATDGGRGAVGGGNGENTSSYQSNISSTVTRYGGSGFLQGAGYVSSTSYDNNNGVKHSFLSFGSPGKGGKGLSSIQSYLLNASNFMALTPDYPDTVINQTLYNAISGGGGGAPTGTPSLDTTIDDYTGGPGGGGGGWENGEDGTAGTRASVVGTGGKGGNGAILYMRVDWD